MEVGEVDSLDVFVFGSVAGERVGLVVEKFEPSGLIFGCNQSYLMTIENLLVLVVLNRL